MHRYVMAGLCCLSMSQAAYAGGLFSGESSANQDKIAPDEAKLVTLENRENEMFPKVSPDGKYLLTLVMQGNDAWISRRSVENGDHLNTVTNDIAALSSFAWFDDKVTFLSSRTGLLSLWKKPSNGEGLMRREMELTGKLQDITLLSDGSLIATRLVQGYKQAHGLSSDHFNNWDMGDLHSYVVHVFPDGSEKRLSEGVSPAVSADGQQVVFSIPMGRSTHLFMMQTDGTHLAELTDARSSDVQPVWSRDGKWVVFTSNRGHMDLHSDSKSNWDIWAISSQGTNLTRLTNDEGRDGSPSVGEDGEIYFHSDRRVDRALSEQRQMKGSTSGFHIWRVKLPAL